MPFHVGVRVFLMGDCLPVRAPGAS